VSIIPSLKPPLCRAPFGQSSQDPVLTDLLFPKPEVGRECLELTFPAGCPVACPAFAAVTAAAVQCCAVLFSAVQCSALHCTALHLSSVIYVQSRVHLIVIWCEVRGRTFYLCTRELASNFCRTHRQTHRRKAHL
jgi:hypothetical protein